MKYLRVICLSIVASLAFLALWVPGSASADALCSVNESPCDSEHVLPFEELLEGSLGGSGSFVFTGVFEQIVCKSSSVSYELTQNNFEGGSGTAIVVEPRSETFGECSSYLNGECSSFKATQLASGPEWIASTTTAGDGYAPSPTGATSIEYTCGLSTCKFEAETEGERPHTHTFSGGAAASESWEEWFVRKEAKGLCGGFFMRTIGQRFFTSREGGLYWTVG